MSIQVFACDHRKNINWKLPYIRIGGQESDCTLNIKDDKEIAPYSVLLSEGAKIWWVWKHLQEFGNPDYIGFCHYRRFFTTVRKQPIIDIPATAFKPEYCMSQDLQQMFLQKNNYSCITFCPLHAVSKQQCNYSNIVDQLKYLSRHDGLGITDDICDKAFELFVNNTPKYLKKYLENAIKKDEMYACNIFTMKRELLDEYCNIFIPTITQLYDYIPKDQFSSIHPRFLGYILERFTSCYIHTLQSRNLKVGILPLMTLDGWKHEPFKIQA